MDGPSLEGIIPEAIEIEREVTTEEDKRIDFLHCSYNAIPQIQRKAL